MKPVVTLYCIADEAGFRLLRGHGGDIQELHRASAESFGDVDYEFSSNGGNRAGRGDISFGHNKTTEAEIERPRLAKHVMRALAAEWANGSADRILLAAGPKMLGALRDATPKALQGHIVADLAKDLSDIPPHDLPSHFARLSEV